MNCIRKLLLIIICAAAAFPMSHPEVSAQSLGYSEKAEQRENLIKNIVLWDVSGSWRKDSKGWMFLLSNEKPAVSQWAKIRGKWYYFDESGYAVKDWQVINGKTYYFTSDNQMKTDWLYTDAWYYLGSDGSRKTGWVKVSGRWYYMNPESGKMQTGWLETDGSWYYLNAKGEMEKGWLYKNGWYYLGGDGSRKTDWVYVNGSWYYLDPESGKMRTGWLEADDEWYYLNSKGEMEKGWLYTNAWYYMGSGGVMQTGWIYDEDDWYYMDPDSGRMKTGWIILDNTWYYLDSSSGAMATDVVYINGKYQEFQSSGVWIGEVEPAGTDPVYYSQRDSRWSSLVFGNWSIYSAGCVPCCLAMIFSALKGTAILPSEIATWLYNNTEEFNRRSIGCGGLGTEYASEHWGLHVKGLGSLSALQTELDAGRMVIAYQGPGLFANAGSSHAVVMYGYSSGSSYIRDPWDTARNGWYSVSTMWGQRSTDPDDNKGGYTYYSIYN